MKNVVWFKDIDKNDLELVGGKGANLGELVKINTPVPDGFVVTSNAYFENINSSGAVDRLKGYLFGLNVDDPVNLAQKAQACQDEIKKIKLTNELEREIETFYKKLSGKKDVYVAVRSSATAEDLPGASFAGQQATFLNIKSKDRLKKAVLNAWASLFEARAIFYRIQKKFDHFKIGIAIPVQKMVQSEVSGVMFTIDPIRNDKNKIIIEAVWGLGELIVSGQVTPDHYEIDKKTFRLIDKKIVSQDKQLVRNSIGNKLLPVSKEFRKFQKLPDEKILELARLGYLIEKHYFFPQDIEWAYEKGKLYIVQTRPVTTIDQKINNYKQPIIINQVLLSGSPASPKMATGKVVVIKNAKELFKVQSGDVLVAPMTSPDFVTAMRRACAIVTERGGRTSHAAIVSRELGIACVVGCPNATTILKNGMIVTVDGLTGQVYKGQLLGFKKNQEAAQNKKQHIPKTATKLYVNIAEPHLASQISAKNVDGVGLLRAEFMLAKIGTHPKKVIKEGNKSRFIEELSSDIAVFCRAFGQRPVIYRSSDLKTNEYRNLKGGENYEPKEENPMLGFRGAFRYIKDPDIFKMELEAIKKVRHNHPNLHLMVPFVRTIQELAAVKDLISESSLTEDRGFKLWMMVEIPSNVIMLEEFIKIGLDGVSIGSNDLTQLILGTDRDNPEVSSEFYELDPSLLWAYEHTIKTCIKHNITSSICGQAPSMYPDLVEKLVSWGITSISVNPDKIENTRQYIYEAEHKLIS